MPAAVWKPPRNRTTIKPRRVSDRGFLSPPAAKADIVVRAPIGFAKRKAVTLLRKAALNRAAISQTLLEPSWQKGSQEDRVQ